MSHGNPSGTLNPVRGRCGGIALRASTVIPMADTDIETRGDDPAALAPTALVGEIARTRADLARTIDEIADRVSPGNVAKRTADRALERLSQVDPLVGGAVALAAVSVTCYLIWRKLRK
jgi:hypothetical protein